MRGIVSKWRPPLALVIGGTLAAVLSLPIIGIVYLRLAGDILGWAETAWLIGWMAVIATAVLGFLLWRLVLRPIYALTRYARAMKAGGDTTAPDHFGTPELSALGASVMAMGDSLHNRAEGMRAYANHVTHELKSPLTAIVGAAELLHDSPGPKDTVALAETISGASARMQVLLDDLARHAQASEPAGFGRSTLSDALAALEMPVPVTIAQDAALPLIAEDVRTVLTQLVRNAAEHGATEKSENPLRNVRTTLAGPLARAFVAPYYVNYHLEHHMVMHVPCWRLPKMHDILKEGAAGKDMNVAPGYSAALAEAGWR